MKRYLFALIVACALQAQTLIQETPFSFTLGAKWDMPFCIVNADNAYFVSGLTDKDNNGRSLHYSALTKISQNFGTVWSVLSQEDSMVSNYYSLAYQNNSVFWFSRRLYGVEISEIVKVDASSGEKMLHIPMKNPNVTLGVWGDKVLVAEGKIWDDFGPQPSFVKIFNPDWSLVGSFVWDREGNGNMTLKTLGDSLWISGYSGSAAIVKKFHLPEGTLLWERRRFVGGNFIYFPVGDLDSRGNFYLAYSEIHGSLPGEFVYYEFGVEKYSSRGDILWQTRWTPLPVKEKQNWNNVFVGVACSEEKNIVVPFGTMDKLGDTTSWYWNTQSAYMAGLNMQTGEIVWDKRWDYPSILPVICVVRAALFDNGDLITVGNSFSRSDGEIPNVCYMQRWAIDRIVGVEESPPSPSSFLLFQNYPNPFNPSTTISFTIPNSEFVSLKVYDVLGNEVATLVNEYKSAGTYNIQFSTLSNQLSSGIYFYKLQAGSFSQSRKMVLLK